MLKNHLLDIESLSKEEILLILKNSQKYISSNKEIDKKNDILRGRTLINLFFEDSTRTRTSFEIAGKRLGADVINMQAKSMATSKGEVLIDTAATINAMKADFITIRHKESGSSQLMANHVDCKVINAGDGWHEHPTQALLDALTISNHKSLDFSKMQIAICGDILHSRVARSNILLLTKMGATIKIAAPKTLIPLYIQDIYNISICNNIEEAIAGVDVVMMLRVQKERMSGAFFPSEREYFNLYGLTHQRLESAHKNALVMHPGPINRGLEIESSLADNIEKTVILEQVELGVAVRQSILELMNKSL